MIRRPDPIKPGDNIGVTAPSYGPGTEPYRSMYYIAADNIKQRGYGIIEGETLFKTDGIGIATKPDFAAKELVEFYKRDDIDAIISAGGGELMNETVTYVDFDELKNYRPKWFIGYSDNTNFIFPLVTITGVQGIYGPCISGYAKKWETPEEDAFAILEGTKSSFDGYKRFVLEEETEAPAEYTEEMIRAPYAFNRDRELVSYAGDNGLITPARGKEIVMEGVLLGGCLDILTHFVGTRFDRMKQFNEEHRNVIWIMEACDLSPMEIRRSLWNLREAGWFDSAAGFIIGRPKAAWGVEMLGADQYNAVTGALSVLGKPIIMDAEISHIDPLLPTIMGADAKVTVKGNDLNITYI
ncbi:LD-carboxypeptidase [Butyrivibrio sp. FCS014]|uniref:LD-carboxypeptidase n=1 Tax=Butyrivibrio sp. FCS014 TaxID=1408304 RepID=UPI0004AE63A9|nr:LD-carboxypeptidase [Butyrivibrio sp. FCS014]